MIWIGIAIGIAIGVFGYLAYEKISASPKLKALEARLISIEKAITGKN